MRKLVIAVAMSLTVLGHATGSSAAEWLDPCNLEAGTYRIDRMTPLMPDPDPADPMEALTHMRRIPAGNAITVLGGRQVKANQWYQVRVGSEVGWVNCTALIGQELAKLN
jgi:hypothetical protein